MRRRNFRALLGATLLTAGLTAAPAQAQEIDRIIAFGDSYADDDNFLQLAGINPVTTPYPTGRFSGGTNYIDTLAAILGVPVENFAIGGAQARNQNGNLPTFGLPYEVDQFFNVGPQSSVFPTIAPTFDEGDLLTVSIGGNDARQYQQIITAGGTPTFTVNDSIASARTQLDRLVAAGAPTISFLAGDTSRLPEIAGNTSAQAIRSTFSSTYNQALQQTLAGYAADGVMVHYLDLNLMLDRVIADPTAYGLQSAGPCPAAQATQCVSDINFANQCLFYVDALHLTSAGFAIVAQYVAAQLAAPLTLQAPSDLGHDTGRQFGRTLSSRADLYGPRAAEPVGGLRFFAAGDFFQRDVEGSDQNREFKIEGKGATAGVEFGFGGGVLGVAANVTRPRVRFGDDSSRMNGRSVQIGAYAGFGDANFFGQGYAGYGKDRHRISRTGVIDNMVARPDGSHVVAGVKAGYLLPLAVFRVGPVAGLDYTRAKVDGYTEEGDAALTLNVGKQSFKSLTGQLGLEARGDFAGEGLAVRPYFAAAVEHDFTGDSRTFRFSQTSAPVIVNEWEVTGEKQTYARLTSGLSADLAAGASVDANLGTTFGRDNGDEVHGQVGVRIGF